MPTYPTPIISRKHGPVLNLVASQTTDLPCLGAALALITVLQAGATSNHTLQISTHEGDQFSNVSAETLDGTYSAPGDTIAFSANKVYMVPVTGAVVFRITTAASSTASVVVSFLTAAEAQAYERKATIVPGTGATNLGKAEDAAHASGDVGVMALAVRANTAAATGANGDYVPLIVDTNGALWVSLSTLIAGEDQTADVLKTEHRYGTSGALLTDTAVKSGAGFLHAITISQNDAAPTAGTIDVYDNTSGSGTKLFTWTLTTAVFTPFTVHLDVSFATGLYVDFTTTADVAVFCSYR